MAKRGISGHKPTQRKKTPAALPNVVAFAFPQDAGAYVALLIGPTLREAAAWWRDGSWYGVFPGGGTPTKAASLDGVKQALNRQYKANYG